MNNCVTKAFSGRIFSRILMMFLVWGMGILPLRAEITQRPLFLVGNVGPNILLLIDDSGSMHYEFMPDMSVGGSLYYAFPPDNNYVYRGGGIYGNTGGGITTSVRIPTFNDNDGLNAFYRSPHNNPLYYNPAKTYEPWVRHDGTYYPKAPTHAAPDNPGYYYDYETGLPRTVSYMNNRTRNLREMNRVILTSSNRYSGDNAANNNRDVTTSDMFWPAFYFHYKGSGGVRDWGSYEKIVIESGKSSYEGHGRETRRDCADAANARCTYEEEIQNFANWYSYHRSRVLTARAGMGKAFRNVGDSVRIGYGTINTSANTDGLGTSVVRRGVRSFYGQDKIDFYRYLYEAPNANSGTPLLRALDKAGMYYQYKDNRGPWGNTPGQDDSTLSKDHISCRGCYTVLMTDGFYSGTADTSGAKQNNDGSTANNTTHESPTGEEFLYAPVYPFRDTITGSLADVAMYYWKTDLRPDLDNNVPVAAGIDPAFWQHMVTFTVGFGVDGTIDPEEAFAAMRSSNANSIGSQSKDGEPRIIWPSTGSNAGKIDDLLHAAVNGRGNFLSANDPDTLAEGMEAVLGEVAKRSAGSISAIATNSTSASDSTLIFQAFMDSFDWTGGVRAYKISANGTIGDIAWSTSDAGKIRDASFRSIYTWSPEDQKGIEFQWNRITSDQKAMLKEATENISNSEANGKDRLEWLRGDQSLEIKHGTNKSVFRNRSLVVGDIVYSDPALVSPGLDFGYDSLPDSTFGKSTYTNFVGTNATYYPILYVGANDGMLHAFDARTTKSATNNTEEGGKEIFAYVPNLVFDKLNELTDPSYEHLYYVNGAPAVGHAYWDGDWRTILVGSLREGGKGLFALDVTKVQTSDNFISQNVLWEMDEERLEAANWKDVGYMFGPPVLAHTKDGAWVAIVGNGYESPNGKASLLIIDLKKGTLVTKIEVPSRPGVTEPNGLSGVTLIADEDRTISRVYAGDLHGQVWQFDLSGNTPASWRIGNFGNPLFIAQNFVDGDDRLIPITAPIAVRNHPTSTRDEHKGYLLYFGTGAYYDEKSHTLLEENTANAFYCIWDRNDGATIDAYSYAPSNIAGGNNSGPLLQQNIIYEVSGKDVEREDLGFEMRIVSDYSMNWYSPDNISGYRGWYLPLIPPSPKKDEGERVTTKASLRNDKVLFTTLMPAPERWDDPCTPNAGSWFMQLDAFTGGRTYGASFDLNKDGSLSDEDLVKIKDNPDLFAVSGIKSGTGVKTLGSFLSVGNLQIALLSSSDGAGVESWTIGDTKLPQSGRHSWREIFLSF